MKDLVPTLNAIQEKKGITTIVSESKEDLYNLFDHLVVEFILFKSVSVIESRKMINKSTFVHLLRQRQASIIQEFDNLFYYRPISIYQISLIIESIEDIEPILIPNFLIPFNEEGITEIEKKEQYYEIKKIMFEKSKQNPFFIGCRLDWLEEIQWLYDDLKTYTKIFYFKSKNKLSAGELSNSQLNLF